MAKKKSSEPQHTPGPWRAELHWQKHRSLKRPQVFGPKHPDGGDYAALCETAKDEDAILIAAAPELLAAAKKMLAFWDDLSKSNPGFMGKLCLNDYQRWNEALCELPNAIAKAESDPKI